ISPQPATAAETTWKLTRRKKYMKLRRMLCSLCLVFFMPATFVTGQSASKAGITGQVLDPQNAVVSNATVTATNQATGFGRSVTTTSTGNYTIPDLSPGTYTVKVDAKGFAAGEADDIVLNVGDQRDLSFKLRVAGSTESVEVTTEAPLLESTRTD